MADKKISELDSVMTLNNDAVFPMSQDNGGEDTTYKATLTTLAAKIAEDMTFSNLTTNAKKLVLAINELKANGTVVMLGTAAPTAQQGNDGNVYAQYTAGTGGAPDEVEALFVKISGAWCEISTGGGSGTTDYEDLSNKPQVNSVELVGNKSLDDLGIMPASLSKTVSGSLVHITDGADNIPVKSLVSQIVAVESGSGEKSPDNPYTISGFDNGIVSVCGKNLFDYNAWKSSPATTARATTVFQNNGVSVTATANDGYVFPSFRIPCVSGETYTLSWNSETNIQGLVYVFFDDNTYRYVQNGTQKLIFTVPIGTNGIRLRFGVTPSGQTINYSNIQLEIGDTATTYEAYNGNNYTFTFGQTVYGGYFDNKGNLVVTHGFATKTWGNYIYTEDLTNCTRRVLGTLPTAQGQLTTDLCDKLQAVISWPSDTPHFYIDGNSKNLVVFMPIGTSDNTTLQFCYELATPITLSITSQDIPTLLGENNIFSNCGDVEVNYYTDNADEIAEVAKATASTPLHNYSTDEQVVGTWIDGKTLYEKTVIITNASKDASYDLGITDFDTCFVHNGSFSGNGVIPYLHGTYPDNSIGGFLDDTGSSLAWAFRSGSQVPATISGFITVRYTKSST